MIRYKLVHQRIRQEEKRLQSIYDGMPKKEKIHRQTPRREFFRRCGR